MPLGKGVRFRAKRISKTRYLRIAFRGNKVLEVKVKKYKKKSKRR